MKVRGRWQVTSYRKLFITEKYPSKNILLEIFAHIKEFCVLDFAQTKIKKIKKAKK